MAVEPETTNPRDRAEEADSGRELLELPRAAIAGGWLAIPAAAAVLALALALLLPPLTSVLRVTPTPAQMPLRVAAGDMKPEPQEQALYLLCLAVPPLVVWSLARLARRLPRVAEATLDRAAVAVQTTIGIAIGATFALQHRWQPDYFTLEGWGLGLMLVLAGLAGARAWRRTGSPWHLGRGLQALAAPGLLAGLAAAAYVAWRLASVVYDDASIAAATDTVSYHLPFTLDEFAAVLNGRTPGVDFFPQYVSLLPYALAPVFRLTGLDVRTFTLAMAGLSLLALTLQYDLLRRVTGRPWVALALFVPFVALAFHPVEVHRDGNVANAFNYFAVGPLRYFGPLVVGWLVAWHLSRPSGVRAFLVFVAAGASALNNLDWGIPALGGAMLALGLTTLAQGRPARAVARLVAVAAAGVAGAFLLFEGVALLHSGRLPSLEELTLFQRLFGGLGFGMLPLPPWGIHWVVYLTFMLGIGTAVVRLEALRRSDCAAEVVRRERLVDGVLVYCGVFGAGALSYYIGRSHWAVLPALFAAWGLVLVLLAWLALSAAHRAGWTQRSVVVPAALAAAALAVGASDALPGAPTEPNGPSEEIGTEGLWPMSAELVKTFVPAGEKVMLGVPGGHLIAELAGVDDVFPFADARSIAVAGQLDLIVEAMRENGVRLYLGPAPPELMARVAAEGLPVDFPGATGP